MSGDARRIWLEVLKLFEKGKGDERNYLKNYPANWFNVISDRIK